MRSESQRWFDYEEGYFLAKQSGDIGKIFDAASCSFPEPPLWIRRDMEYQYRKGYQFGFLQCAEYLRRLYRQGGFVRPSEIANILELFAETELRNWRNMVWREQPLVSECGEPKLKKMNWLEIRKSVFLRDGNACTECGATENLEAHHICAVKCGGTPEMDNLQTLCAVCHRAAK